MVDQLLREDVWNAAVIFRRFLCWSKPSLARVKIKLLMSHGSKVRYPP